MRESVRSALGYGIATASSIAALAMTMAIPSLRQSQNPILLLVPVIIASWFGWAQGLLAIGLSLFFYVFYVVPPVNTLVIDNWPDALRLILFLGLAMALNTMVQSQNRTLKAIRYSERRLNAVLEATGIGMWQLNLETGELSVTPGFEKMIGREAGSFFATYAGLMACFYRDDRLVFSDRFTAAAMNGTNFKADHRLERPDGRAVRVNTRVYFRKGDDGRPLMAIGVVSLDSGLGPAELTTDDPLANRISVGAAKD